MENTNIVIGYLIYLPIVISLTIFVSKSLFKNGRIFMIDIFKGNEEIALATNKLFEIGFYLINIGFALFIMKLYYYSTTLELSYQRLMEMLSVKIGGFTIYLGIMLFLNLFLFFRGRRKSKLTSKTKVIN
jgi:uncharacterized membrane protein